MKLAKLSLAAIMAVGALATTSSAANLEDAIKGVDLSGFSRYRFYSEDGVRDASGDRNRFSGEFLFTVPAGDNLSAGVSLKYESSQYAANANAAEPNVSVNQAWFKYATKDYSVKAGKMVIATPWNDGGYNGHMGNGVIGMYTGVKGWTFAGAAFSQTNIKIPVGNYGLAAVVADAKTDKNYGVDADYTAAIDTLDTLNGGTDVGQENLYAVAAIGSVGPVNAQIWLANMTNVFDYSVFVQADMKMAGFGLLVQANQLKLADELDILADDTGLFYGVEGSFAVDGFGIKAGYTSTDDDQPVYALTGDNGGMLKFGKQLYYETTNVFAAETMYAKVSYGSGAYGVGAGYGQADIDGNDLGNEFYVDASYKYSKHFGMTAYYSDMNIDDYSDADNKQIRFEAKYSF